MSEYMKAYRQNPQSSEAKAKQDARMRLNRVKYAGTIQPKPCEVCGAVETQAHHEDYTKPFKVRWLCRQHHEDLHHRD